MGIESSDLKKLQDLANRQNRVQPLGDVVSVEIETDDSTLADRLKINVVDNTAVQTKTPRDENGDLIIDAHIKVDQFRREVAATKNGEVIINGHIDMGSDAQQTTVADNLSKPRATQLKF